MAPSIALFTLGTTPTTVHYRPHTGLSPLTRIANAEYLLKTLTCLTIFIYECNTVQSDPSKGKAPLTVTVIAQKSIPPL